VGAGGEDGVGEVISEGVALVAEVEPGVAVLVDEERSAVADVVEAGVISVGAVEHVPRGGRDGVGGRADGEEVEHHELGVGDPVVGEEAGLGLPAHAESAGASEHPSEVDAVVEGGGEFADLRLDAGAGEVGASGERTAEQHGGVDGGEFAVADARAGDAVIEVVEEAVDVGELVDVVVERGEDSLADVCRGEIAVEVCDAERGEAEAGGGDAGVAARLGAGGAGAVEHLAGDGASLLPEELAAAAGEVVKECVLRG